MVLVTKGLTKYYGKQMGIEGVDLSVKKGEIYGFIGPNGAGKSTTIRCIMGLLKPDNGKILLFRQDAERNMKQVKHNIGYVPSEVYYYEDMTVSKLLHYSASFYNKNLKSRITYLADILALDMNKKFEDLSYGNKKKVAIAQALLHSPELIILDEPTSGLDPLMKKKLFELLAEENKKGATIFFSSHVLSEVQQLCHRIGMMKEGKIIKEATFDEIRSNVWTKFRVQTEEALSIPLRGVKDLKKDDNVYSFIYAGNIDILIKELSRHTITFLEATEPPLEEIFLHYYEN